jgi:hypothetical protein
VRRQELAHLLRAAARIADDGEILVVGSQAILASFAEDELPEIAWLSVEADLAFFDEAGGQRKADEVDGAIGELSQFHETYSYYAQGVDLTTAKLPNGWHERLVIFAPDGASPAHARCLDRHDLVIAKLVAMREKDQAFAIALLDAGLVDLDVLRRRARELDCVPAAVQRRVREWLEAVARRQAGNRRPQASHLKRSFR